MCGIAGIFLKDHSLEPRLGALLTGMLAPLSDRGPDSAGFAVYGEPTTDHVKLTLRAPTGYDYEPLLRIAGPVPAPPQIHDTHLVITVPAERQATVLTLID